MTSPFGEPKGPNGPLRPARQSRWPWLLALFLVAGLICLLIISLLPPQAQLQKPPLQTTADSVGQGKASSPGQEGQQGLAPLPPPPSKHGDVVDITSSSQEQAQRKRPFGLDKSLDAVVRSDESIRVGGQTIKVAELERKLTMSRGEILDQALDEKERISAWGLHLVREDDNLWFIHLHLLREYMASKGVEVKRHADKPNAEGRSSGVGKILKFAENMVGVYNLKSQRISPNLDLLEPGQKVIVFNLSEIFEQLAKIDPRDISGVMYDGRVLLFSERAPKGTKTVPVPAQSNN